MWEFADPDLFRSRSSPSVAVIGQTIHNGTRKWVAFFVSGKNDNNSMLPVDDIHRYPSIYMIDIADGSVLERIFLNSEPNGINGIPSGQPAVVDSDGNGYIDRIYIGTDKGYLYKVTIPDCPSKLSTYGITNCVINTDIGSAARNPIYASPAVVVQNTINDRAEIKDYMIKIMFGTSDSPYYDDNLPGPYHFFAYVDTAKKTDTCNSSKVTLDWLYQLPAGERIFASAFAAAGAVYFGTATSETTDPCEGSGNPASNLGRLYVMNIKQTGSPTPKFTKDTGNILTAPVVDDQNLYVKTLFGMFTTGNPYNNPGVGPVGTSVTTWREIFSKDQTLVPSPTPSP
jgi:Tfp pilus tip-associated adhesin PilY1